MCSYKILNGGTTTKCSRIPWQTSVMCFYVILALMKIASCEVLPSVKEFFPSINNDLTKVTWAPEVSIAADINKAKKEKKMMIEGHVILNKPSEIPWIKNQYRGHDITLNVLLNKVVAAKSFGVKLNFVFISEVREAIKVLQSMKTKLTFPLWLNVETSNMNNKEIDEFLSLCTHNFPEATISIGFFRKGYKAPQKPKEYEAELITKMKDTLTRNNVTQTVAFPVDLVGASYSLDTLPALKDVPGITDSALYMYGGLTGTDDYLDVVSKIRSLINDFGKDRVYLNLGKKLVKDLI